MIELFQFEDAMGGIVGCGTQLEFDHWTREGTFDGYRVGRRIGWEHPREDEKRRKAWGEETAHDRFAAAVRSDQKFSA